MLAKTFKCASLVLVLLLATACASEQPVSNESSGDINGRWSGEYELPNGRNEPIAVDLLWKESNLSGTVRAGFRSIPLKKASFAPDTGAITMVFDTEGSGGRAVQYVIDGKINGTTMTGTWTHDGQKGIFQVRKE